MIIGYTVPEIWCVPDVIVIFQFELFLPFHPPNSPKNENTEKKNLEISSFYTSVTKIMIIDYIIPEVWRINGCNCYFSF